MKTDKVVWLIVIVAVVGGLFAADWYYFDYLPRKAEYEQEGVGPMPETSDLSGAGDVSAETFESRDSQIIECEDPAGGKFYTDADSCEKADLEAAESTVPALPDKN